MGEAWIAAAALRLHGEEGNVLGRLYEWRDFPVKVAGSEAALRAAKTGDLPALPFWRKHSRNPGSDFHVLATVATALLSIVPSGASVERTFSAFGNVWCDRRSRLNSERVRKLVYIYVNHKAMLREGDARDADSLSAFKAWMRSMDPDGATDSGSEREAGGAEAGE